jgi:small nuclear ribonucleoprotein (snRNP)-like protein
MNIRTKSKFKISSHNGFLLTTSAIVMSVLVTCKNPETTEGQLQKSKNETNLALIEAKIFITAQNTDYRIANAGAARGTFPDHNDRCKENLSDH